MSRTGMMRPRSVPRREPSILEGTTDCAFVVDADWRFRFLNSRAVRELGGIAVGASLWDVVPRDDGLAVESLQRAMERREATSFDTVLGLGKRVEMHATPWADGVAVFFRTSEDDKAAGNRDADARLQLAIEATGLGVWDIELRTGAINASREFRAILGLTADERITRERLAELIVGGEDRAAFERRLALVLSGRAGERLDGTYLIRSAATGEQRWIRVLGSILPDKRGRTARLIGTVNDITDSRMAEERVRHAANHDTLTGLPNRLLFRDRLEELLGEAKAGEGKLGLLLLDLDGFKDINDSLGPDVGDELLTVIGQRLLSTVEDPTLVSRHGGDEFAILMPDADDAAAVEAFAQRIARAIGEPVVVGDRVVEPRGSIGASLFPMHGTESTELMRNADVALYAAKSRGRSRVVVYEGGMWKPIITRLEQQLNARQAIVDDRILPFYQPQIDLETGEVIGFEALLRWVHPVSGLRTPEGIWAAFNHPDLAYEIGRRILDSVLADIVRWRAAGVPLGHIAINVSEPELRRGDFVDGMLGRIAAAGLPNGIIEVEITETVFFGRDTETIAGALRQLHDAGISIALDDFGTGFASLTHLRQYPIRVIKIDQSFTRELDNSPEALAIVRAVINLGAGLGMKVVAEGVSTPLQRDLLARAKCNYGQGFLFGRPMIAHRVPQFLRTAAKEVLAGAGAS